MHIFVVGSVPSSRHGEVGGPGGPVGPVSPDLLSCSDSFDEHSDSDDEILSLLFDPPSYLEYLRKERLEHEEELELDLLSESLTLEWRVSDKFLDEPPPLQRLRLRLRLRLLRRLRPRPWSS